MTLQNPNKRSTSETKVKMAPIALPLLGLLGVQAENESRKESVPIL